jgi:hypothetical protein
MNHLKTILHRHFSFLFHTAQTHLCPNHPLKWTHHPLLGHLPLYQSFLGKWMCGDMVYVTKLLLEQYGYKPKVYTNRQGYGDYATDHCYLSIIDNSLNEEVLIDNSLNEEVLIDNSLNEEVLIDPTYRQILETDSILHPDSTLLNMVHIDLPPYFIGTRGDLHQLGCSLLEDRGKSEVCLDQFLRRFQADLDDTSRFQIQYPIIEKCIIEEIDNYKLYSI